MPGRILSILLIAMCGAGPTLADAPPATTAPTLDGLYQDDATGGTIQITQSGDAIRGVWVDRQGDIFHSGDWALRGTVSGSSITGSVHLRFPLQWQEWCPQHWDHEGDLTMTLSADGSTLSGSHQVFNIHKKTCTMEPASAPVSIVLHRVPPKKTTGAVTVGPLDDGL
jgi:hypothetical protein